MIVISYANELMKDMLSILMILLQYTCTCSDDLDLCHKIIWCNIYSGWSDCSFQDNIWHWEVAKQFSFVIYVRHQSLNTIIGKKMWLFITFHPITFLTVKKKRGGGGTWTENYFTNLTKRQVVNTNSNALSINIKMTLFIILHIMMCAS